MDKQKVVVVLLIVAIVLSAINLFMNAAADFGGFTSVNQQVMDNTSDDSSAELVLHVGDNGGNSG